jgi:hypothetical protein
MKQQIVIIIFIYFIFKLLKRLNSFFILEKNEKDAWWSDN